jgi:Domain of unknown function (DUF4265)
MGHDLVRIVFELDPSAWHGNATERLWAEPVGRGRFRLRNSPFFAFGVSFEDIVFGEERGAEICFTGVSMSGGHSTYRLILADRGRGSAFQKQWEQLASLGCSYEEGRVLAVDVPPPASIDAVYKLLEDGLANKVWDFEEGHCGHPLGKGVAG